MFKYCAVHKQDVHWGEESIHFLIIYARSASKQQEHIFIFNIVRAWDARRIVFAEHNAFRQNLKNPSPWFRIDALENCEQN